MQARTSRFIPYLAALMGLVLMNGIGLVAQQSPSQVGSGQPAGRWYESGTDCDDPVVQGSPFIPVDSWV